MNDNFDDSPDLKKLQNDIHELNFGERKNTSETRKSTTRHDVDI